MRYIVCDLAMYQRGQVLSLVSRPLLFRSAGCITSPARGRKGLETLARFSCANGMQSNVKSHDRVMQFATR